MKKIAFFDIDDTLLDHSGAQKKALLQFRNKFFPDATNKQFETIWNESLKRNWKLFTLGQISFEDQRIRRIQDVWNVFQEKISKKEALEFFKIYLVSYKKNWKIFAGIKYSLRTFKKKGISLGIISNGNTFQQIQKLKHTGIYNLFNKNLIVISEKFGYSKPDKRIFMHAQRLSGRNSKEIVYFGNELEEDFNPGRAMEWETVLATSPKVINEWVSKKL